MPRRNKKTREPWRYVKPRIRKHGSLKGLAERVTGSKKEAEF